MSFTETIQSTLDDGNPNKLFSAARVAKLGTMLTPQKLTFTGLAASATHNITDAAHGGNPAIQNWTTLRVTGGGAAAGARLLTDVGGTPSSTVATLSDDGTTIVFEGTVTGFVLEYTPRAAVAMTSPLEKT